MTLGRTSWENFEQKIKYENEITSLSLFVYRRFLFRIGTIKQQPHNGPCGEQLLCLQEEQVSKEQ